MYAKNKRTTPMKDSVFGACLCVGSSSSHEFLFFVACVWLSLVRLLCYNQMHWNGCGLILHELCHVLHQQVLPGGLDNEHVHLCYQVAQHNLQQQQPHSARQSQSPSSTPITTRQQQRRHVHANRYTRKRCGVIGLARQLKQIYIIAWSITRNSLPNCLLHF